ncbi:iron complex outermembrane receptor protein [Pseudoxanthomonas japonensis]|uniref:TonB-dependent receptor plug domain-containing protein n=1 Tax=Pseudoxanthomonas TaxID=83618 RepID=UPI000781DFE5|nr:MULTISPECIES: TonB-dependent receptor [Pseudoxanthomonas]MBL8256568.1 TonB-dependent receptor [Pseudoxanthomonas mexicana]MDR7067858.1 iron complex outermembrane receptor protein [Pseudoxanthomonas japonensis]
MNRKTTKLREAISFALAAGAVSAIGTGSALAQAAQGEATTLDRIEVTGTRIRQVDTETAQPVFTLSRADIEKQGFQSVADILQNISAMGPPSISRASPLSAGEIAGGTYISMRNLGAQRTLVLVNGKRLGISTSGFADVSLIPAVAVERIEVLKDGASSTYGSDAIAGVINIITRSNYEGAAASAYYGQYGEGDGAIKKGDFVMGFTGDRGSLTVAAEWGEEDVVKASDRPYSAFPRSSNHPTDQWTTAGQVGGFTETWANRARYPNVTFTAPSGTTTNPSTRIVLRDGGDPRNAADYIRQDINVGSCTAAGCTPGSTLHKSNTNMQTDLRTPVERKGLYVDGVFDITDNIRFRTNLLYANRVTDRTVAGYPMQAASFGSSNGGTGVPLAATSYFNPIGAPITTWWRRTWEVPRVSTSDLTTYRFSGAFEGSFELADRLFDWDVSYLSNKNTQVQKAYGNLNLANVARAVGPSYLDAASGQVRCGTAASPIAGCVAWNPLLPYGSSGQGSLTNNQALQNYLFQEEHSTGETKTTVLAANLAGTIVALPAGDLGFALGVENRKEEGTFVPDALAQTGGSTNLSAGPTGGKYTVNEVYLELQVPILADLPFARELSLNVASRYSDYDTFGSTVNNKFGMKWKPIDSLMLRATYADGFRAPTISDLYGGGSQTFSFFTDPCDTNFGSSASNATTRANCVAAMGAVANTFRQLGQGLVPAGSPNTQTPIAFTSGSNPLLTPELSKSQTLGAVWSPSFIEGLNISLDWWKIRIGDTIVTDSPTQMLNDCFIQGITSRCSPTLFTRDAALGYVNFLSFGNRNAGFRKVEGFDFDVAYRWSTENFGNFNVSSNTTYTAKDYFVSTNDPTYATSGVGFTSAFRIRSNLGVNWQMGAWGVSWTARYYSSMKEGCTYFTTGSTAANLECNEIVYAPTGVIRPDGTPDSAISRRNRVGSNTFNDVQVRWDAPWNATISIGANNVFEKVGPVMYTQPSANVSYYGNFDIGRFVYMKYTQKF